ncbi:MAG: DUF2971 domain-containing protein [Polyangiaceae bacterium]|nr:DUF2971 domain-containing protein [Polyangiaceae bacterium]
MSGLQGDREVQLLCEQMERELGLLIPETVDTSPDVVFHYTTNAGLLGILSTKCVRATHYGYLNDPTELTAGEQLAIGLLDEAKRKYDNDSPEAFLLDSMILNFKMLCPSVWAPPYLTCFSKHDDSLSQWRAYGGNGNGYALGFAIVPSDQQDPQQPFNAAAAQCIYDDTALSNRMAVVVDKIAEVFAKYAQTYGPLIKSPEAAGEMTAGPICIGIRRLVGLALRHKAAAYADEEEWRVVAMLREAPSKNPVEFSLSAAGLSPFIEISFAPPPSSLELKKIVIGPSLDQDRRERVVHLMLQRYGFDSVKVAKSAIPYRGP